MRKADAKQTGLQPLTLPTISTQPPNPNTHPAPATLGPIESPSLPLPQKRKLSATDLEIPDSEGEDDEDYGWAEEDEEDIPPMPPQWQGSEDILVPPAGELESENEEIEEEDEERPGEEADEGGGVNSDVLREIVEDSEDELAL